MKYFSFLSPIPFGILLFSLSSCIKSNQSGINESQDKRVKILDQVRSIKLHETWDETVNKFDPNDVTIDLDGRIITEKIFDYHGSPHGFVNFEIRFSESRVYYAIIRNPSTNETVWSIGDGRVYLELE
jgi:hypothetical protein